MAFTDQLFLNYYCNTNIKNSKKDLENLLKVAVTWLAVSLVRVSFGKEISPEIVNKKEIIDR